MWSVCSSWKELDCEYLVIYLNIQFQAPVFKDGDIQFRDSMRSVFRDGRNEIMIYYQTGSDQIP